MPGPQAASNADVEKTPEQLAQENTDLQAKIDALEAEKADGAAAAAKDKEKLEKQIAELKDSDNEKLLEQIKELEGQLAEKDATLKDFINNRGDEIPVIALRTGKATRQYGVVVKGKGKEKDKKVKKVEVIRVTKGERLTMTREAFNRLGNPLLPSPLVQVDFGL